MDTTDRPAGANRDSARRVASLSPAQLDLLARQLKQRNAQIGQPSAILRRSESRAVAPLSLAQERLWFIEQLFKGRPVYTRAGVTPFKGLVNRLTLEQVLNEIVRRHEILRTTFATVEGEPVQAIHPAAPKALPLVDLSRLAESERQQQAVRLARQDRRRAFDLMQEWPLRVRLLVLQGDEAVLLQAFHHIAYDAWSTSLFMAETEALYKAFAA